VIDIFSETKRLVTAREAAEMYGFQPNRAGFICCPFHMEKTPSLKLYPDGSWHCFGCGASGTVIDFVSKLFDLSPLDAVRKINQDFRLALPIDKPQTIEEQKAIQHRKEVNETYQLFEEWCNNMIRQLNSCFRLAHEIINSLETPSDLDKLTDAQAFVIQEQAHVEWLADTLTHGSMEEIMNIFRERELIYKLCKKVLNNMSMKSSAA